MKTVIQTSTGKVLRAQTHDIIGNDETLIDDLLTVPMIEPYYIDGQFIEKATPEEIAKAETERCKPTLSRMVFFRNVWRVLQLTEEDILAEVEKIEDVNERIEIRNMVRNASEFERQHPDLLAMSEKMGIHQTILNQIFA